MSETDIERYYQQRRKLYLRTHLVVLAAVALAALLIHYASVLTGTPEGTLMWLASIIGLAVII